MRQRLAWNLAIIFTIAAAIGLSLMFLPGRSHAQGGGIRVQAVTGTAFTYQGRLMYHGTAISGTCSLSFALYDAAGSGSPPSGGTQVGSTVTNGSVPVSDGYFGVNLDFGSGAFTGEPRWLEIKINSCPGGASGATLSPRVQLYAVPYALSLHPGAIISGSVADGIGLKVVNGTVATGAVGIYGQADSPNISIPAYGVYGKNTTNGYGVYGESTAAGGYGVYSKGNAHVEGQFTWKPITGHVSIPSASFLPESSSTAYTGSAGWLHDVTPFTTNSQYYSAGVQLPDGATITKLTFYWKDSTSTGDGSLSLQRNSFDMSTQEIGAASTSGSAGDGVSSDTTLFYTLVDNTQYAYLLRALLPPNSIVYIKGAVIEYTIDRPY